MGGYGGVCILYNMKPVFLFLLLLTGLVAPAQSVYLIAGSDGLRIYTEFKSANGIYQVVQNEKGEVMEVSRSPRGLLVARDFERVYYFNYNSREHVYSEDMRSNFEFDIFGKLDEIGGRSVHTWFHAPDTGPFILDEVGDLRLKIDLVFGVIEEINGMKATYDSPGGRMTRVGSTELNYYSGERVVIKE